jgi:hypothetical protein
MYKLYIESADNPKLGVLVATFERFEAAANARAAIELALGEQVAFVYPGEPEGVAGEATIIELP